MVRAFNPVPGAQTSLDGAPLKIWSALPLSGRFGDPATIVAADVSGIVVACGEGALSIVELQRASARRMDARSFLAGCPLRAGTRLGSVV
jgi:methionyl-tRNA formyltransferase